MHFPSRLLPPRFLLTALLACVLAACAMTPSMPASRAADAHAHAVLLVSLDGFHPRYLDAGIAPALSRIASEGVRAEWMNPSYPSLTFPNHYTLVTGLRPDRHGIVHNTMRDATIEGGFWLSNRAAVGDSRWWGGEPIWVRAEKAGLRSATLYWPGSEAEIAGLRPTRWTEYVDSDTLPLEVRVDTVLDWLSEDRATRPRLVTLYFETVDKQAHEYGPDSLQAQAAVRTVDAALGRLLHGLQARGLRDDVDLIVVSDHGMATVPPGQWVVVEDVVSREEATVVSTGQVVQVVPNAGFETRVEQKLLGAQAQYDCWRKGELPARWHYGSHPRVAPIVCQMHEGWDMLPRAATARRPAHERGSHGYDPALPSMHALFVAAGPSFREGVVLPAFDNVDVYPLLARLLGVEPAPNDGSIEPLRPALRDAGSD